MGYFFIPLFILAGFLVLFGIMVFLGRFRNGRYLKPIIETLSKIPWLRRQFQKLSQAAIEKSNPELASAMRKIQRVGPNPDEKRAQAAFHSLSPSERRAYQEFAEAQGVGTPEAANRQQRRRLEKMNQANKVGPANRQRPGASGTKRKRK
ncbi:MAG TPA: hypothetical protein VGM80_15855 [Gaiellaceae bacterium]